MENWPGYAQRFVGPAYALFLPGDQAGTPAKARQALKSGH
jgi:hypothetical protein